MLFFFGIVLEAASIIAVVIEDAVAWTNGVMTSSVIVLLVRSAYDPQSARSRVNLLVGFDCRLFIDCDDRGVVIAVPIILDDVPIAAGCYIIAGYGEVKVAVAAVVVEAGAFSSSSSSSREHL